MFHVKRPREISDRLSQSIGHQPDIRQVRRWRCWPPPQSLATAARWAGCVARERAETRLVVQLRGAPQAPAGSHATAPAPGAQRPVLSGHNPAGPANDEPAPAPSRHRRAGSSSPPRSAVPSTAASSHSICTRAAPGRPPAGGVSPNPPPPRRPAKLPRTQAFPCRVRQSCLDQACLDPPAPHEARPPNPESRGR